MKSKEVKWGNDGKLCLVRQRSKVLKDYVEIMMNEERVWDDNVVEKAQLTVQEVVWALNGVSGTSSALSPILSLDCCWQEVISTDDYVRVLGGLGMPADWPLNIVVPFFKGKGDISNLSCYKAC